MIPFSFRYEKENALDMIIGDIIPVMLEIVTMFALAFGSVSVAYKLGMID